MKKTIRQTILIFYDIIAIYAAYFVAFFLRFDMELFTSENAIHFFNILNENFLVLLLIKLFVLMSFGMYNSLWKHASMTEMLQVLKAVTFATAMSMSYMIISQLVLPRSIYIMTILLDLIFIGGMRFSYRFIRTIKNRQRKRLATCINVIVIGAGQAGAMIIREMLEHPESNYYPVAIIDDDPLKHKSQLMGISIAGGRESIQKMVTKYQAKEILIAIPSLSRVELKELIEIATRTSAKLKTVPSVYEIIDGRITINQIREVDIKDVLGREEIDLEIGAISEYIQGQTVLVTGAGGSIGSELCRQIAPFAPSKLLMLDIYENNVYTLSLELKKMYPKLDHEIIIASVRDRKRIFELFEMKKPDVVFHAAAHKHVPLMEANPAEAIKNNVFGTQNVVEAAIESKADRFTLISTDKAVNPTNVMGASKRICELIVQGYCHNGITKLSAVRFGNVLGSNGSVIPIFKKQIEQGGPVTITHTEIIRYFMTIPEASRLVIQATSLALEGEIFILDMGDPIKIVDLAENMIKLSGFEPYQDIKIEITGLRPGEKLYEELILDKENTISTKYNKIFIEKPDDIDQPLLFVSLENLRSSLETSQEQHLVEKLTLLVPSFMRKSNV